MTKDEIEFAEWKAERDEARRKSGAYWLTTEGRDELRDCFSDHDDGNAVRPLLDYVERLEKRLEAYETSTQEHDQELHASICEALIYAAECNSGPEAAGWLDRAATLIRANKKFEYFNAEQAVGGGLTQTPIE